MILQRTLWPLESVVFGQDCDIIPQILRVHEPPGSTLVDCTAGTRIMWRGSGLRPTLHLDIDPAKGPDAAASFYALPVARSSVDVLVYDPPHLPATYGQLDEHAKVSACNERYGLKHGVADHARFCREAAQVLRPKGLLLAKLIDYVRGDRYQFVLGEFVRAAENTGLRLQDVIVKSRRPGPHSGKWRKHRHSRRSHSWWIVCRRRARP